MADDPPNLTQEQLNQLFKDQIEANLAKLKLKLNWNMIILGTPEEERMDMFRRISSVCDGESNLCVLAACVHHLSALISYSSLSPNELVEVVIFALRHYTHTNQANATSQDPAILAAMKEKPDRLN